MRADSEESARRMTERIIKVIRTLKTNAFMWRVRDELFEGARMVRGRPYAVLYKTDGARVMVVRIVHDHRDLGALFFNEKGQT